MLDKGPNELRVVTPSESTLIRHCRWVHIHDGLWLADEFGVTKGNRVKFVAYPDRLVAPIKRPPYRYYWKESLPRFPLEFWSEVLAYHIGSVVAVPVPPCFPATYRQMLETEHEIDRIGSLSLSLVEPSKGEELIHGGDLLSIIKPDYERRKGAEHSVQLILKALDGLIGDISLYALFFRQLVFDALIGNSDRHQDNWGIRATIVENMQSKFEMLPAFDNGTSLGRELEEAKIRSCLNNQDEIEGFIRRGKAHVRWDGTVGAEHLQHEELMRRHLQTFPKSRRVFDEIINFNESALRRAVGRVCRLSRDSGPELDVSISPAREEFINRVILRRRELLRSL